MDDLRSERLEASGRDEIKRARPQVVIIGAGFAGLSAAKALARTAVDVTVVDRARTRNSAALRKSLADV
jgi:NADH dehydrogenase FAD-containing subunit